MHEFNHFLTADREKLTEKPAFPNYTTLTLPDNSVTIMRLLTMFSRVFACRGITTRTKTIVDRG